MFRNRNLRIVFTTAWTDRQKQTEGQKNEDRQAATEKDMHKVKKYTKLDQASNQNQLMQT